jgi:hypothetical protein
MEDAEGLEKDFDMIAAELREAAVSPMQHCYTEN